MLTNFDKNLLIAILVSLVLFLGVGGAGSVVFMYISLVIFLAFVVLVPMYISIILSEIWKKSKDTKTSFTRNVTVYIKEL